jgi:hypothetical protein
MPYITTTTIQQTQQQFEYQVENDGERLLVVVYGIPRNAMRFYQHTFLILSEGRLRSTTMDVNGCVEFRKMGIPEAIINEICSTMNVSIESSSKKPIGDDFMIGASVAVWRRLVNQFPERCTEGPERFLINPQQ